MKIELRRGPLPDEGKARAELAAAVLDGVVNQELLVAEAKRRRLGVGAVAVRRAIRRFLAGAKATVASVRAALRRAGASWREFGESVRAELLARAVFDSERLGIRVGEAEMRRARDQAQWRGEGHLPDAALRARLVARRLAERVEHLVASLRERAQVTLFLKAGDVVGAAERKATEEKALAFYRERNPGAPAALAAEVVPMGCHSEIAIRHGNRTVATLGYASGKVFELGKR